MPRAAEDPTALDLVRAEDEQRQARWAGFQRIRVGYPQSVSAGLGVIRARLPKSWDCVTTCPYRGLVLQIEPGLHGAQLSAGYATMMAEQRHRKRFLADIYLAFGVKGVLLKTWNGATLTPEDRTFAGVEFSLTVTRINISVGTLRRVDSGPGGDWIATAGMGWGF
jgi:hypothetical protein